MKSNGLVIDEKILLAATSLPSNGFTAEDLVVAAFQKFPDAFCLMGYPQYPDSNKVLTQITTAGRGLQKRAWLRKIGTKRYQLTNEGLRFLERLEAPETVRAARPDNRDVADLFKHWLRSSAYDKSSRDHWEEISEREALAFWRLTSGATAARTHQYLAIAESAARLLKTASEENTPSQVRHDLSIAPDEARRLVKTHEGLKEKFSEAIDYLRSQRR